MAYFRLGKEQLLDLATIREAGSNAINSAVSQLNSLTLPPLKLKELESAVQKAFPSKSTAEAVMKIGMSWNGLMRRSGLSPDAVVSSVRDAVNRDSEWTEGDRKKWEAVEPSFQKLISVGAFRIVAKALDLAYDYANLYRKARVLTDIRPLFDENVEKVDAAVISYTLRLSFDSADGDHAISVAMDDDDVREMIEQCQRALAKAALARELVVKKLQVPAIVAGEQNDD